MPQIYKVKVQEVEALQIKLKSKEDVQIMEDFLTGVQSFRTHISTLPFIRNSLSFIQNRLILNGAEGDYIVKSLGNFLILTEDDFLRNYEEKPTQGNL